MQKQNNIDFQVSNFLEMKLALFHNYNSDIDLMIFPIFTLIIAPIFVLLLYFHRKFFFYPKELASIPSIPFIKRFKSAINGTPEDESFTEFKKYIMAKGVYKVKFLSF